MKPFQSKHHDHTPPQFTWQPFANLSTWSLSAIACLCLLLLALLPASAHAECSERQPGWLWNYNGTIGDRYRVHMTLVLDGQEIEGSYFYASQLRDIPLKGTVKNDTDIVLNELDNQGRATARFEGKFVQVDPAGKFTGKLHCEVIVGHWQKLGDSTQRPVDLRMESATSGTLSHRYGIAGVGDDALVDRNAYRFWDAVKRGDKKTVAILIAYPIKVRLPTGNKRLRGPADLIADYDAIFSPKYREAIVNAVPYHMFARDQGIMLGNGEVWFGSNGKVIGLNNY
jgi:hypothetical protein